MARTNKQIADYLGNIFKENKSEGYIYNPIKMQYEKILTESDITPKMAYHGIGPGTICSGLGLVFGERKQKLEKIPAYLSIEGHQAINNLLSLIPKNHESNTNQKS